ncbi:MAG: hypothetical protein HON99_01420 [Crocinitomicaceae bacterium]|nr:hypothetical protein [Crocinitomicaceae bacterium]
MKLLIVVTLVILAFGSQSQTASINWLTWDEAISKSKTDSIPKKCSLTSIPVGVVGVKEWMQLLLKTLMLLGT